LLLYLAARFCSSLATQIQVVAVGWQVYDLTRDPFALGYVGLAQFLPMVILVLPAGDLADRVDRRLMLIATCAIAALAAASLLAFSILGVHTIWPFYAAAALYGCAVGLQGPAVQSFLAFLVPSEDLPRAIAWGSSVSQTASISGPALGGLLYVFGAPVTYSVVLALLFIAGSGLVRVRIRAQIKRPETQLTAFRRVTEGLRYVWSKPMLVGAITLDLFAVLFGGTTALLPIFARDILHIGPLGLGALRSAPAIGAATVAAIIARYPLQRHLGHRMYWAVSGFGLATVIFGLSRDFWLSLAALIVLGASDQVSVVIRNSLVQIATPDHMRGRVSAVHMLFVGTSNQLGEFRAGVSAGFFGAITAAVLGGVGTLAIVGLWLPTFPALRRIDKFSDIATN
jgi:MFS family permease